MFVKLVDYIAFLLLVSQRVGAEVANPRNAGQNATCWVLIAGGTPSHLFVIIGVTNLRNTVLLFLSYWLDAVLYLFVSRVANPRNLCCSCCLYCVFVYSTPLVLVLVSHLTIRYIWASVCFSSQSEVHRVLRYGLAFAWVSNAIRRTRSIGSSLSSNPRNCLSIDWIANPRNAGCSLSMGDPQHTSTRNPQNAQRSLFCSYWLK